MRSPDARYLAPGVGLLVLISACGSTVAGSAAGTNQLGSAPPLSGTTAQQSGGPAGGGLPAAGHLGMDGQSNATSRPSDGTNGTSVGSSGPNSRTAGQSLAASAASGKPVEVGIATQNDASQVGGATGYSSLDFGDQRSLINAILTWINKHGGLAGHPIVPVWYDASTWTDPTQEAQTACSLWTQDHHVIAASLLGRLDIDPMFQCLHKAHVLFDGGFAVPMMRADALRFSPEIIYTGSAVFDRFVPVWVDRLLAQGYFGGWDTAQGKPGTAPTKVGILYQVNPLADRAFAELKSVLESKKIPVPDVVTFTATNPQQISNYVLKFRQEGVTHVFLDNLAGFFYPSQAESQGYRARYAVSTANFIEDFLLSGATPKAQLAGMMGIGWEPGLDVAAAQDPGTNRAQKACLQAEHAAGADVSKRNYQYVAYVACDFFGLLQRAAAVENTAVPSALIRGVHRVVGSVQLASEFGLGDYGSDPSLLSLVRDLSYGAQCSCTKYTSTDVRL